MSKSLSKTEIQDLKSRFKITDVAHSLGLNVVNGRCKCWQTENHAHGDRTPSVSFNDERGLYKCWVCSDIKGDSIDLIQRIKSCSFIEAIEWLSPEKLKESSPRVISKSNVNPQLTLNDKKLEKPQSQKVKMEPQRQKEILSEFLNQCQTPSGAAFKYLKSRNIFMPIIEKHQIKWVHDYSKINGWLKRNYSQEELVSVGLCNERGHLRFFRHPLLLPYFDRNNKVAFIQGRAIEEGIQPRFLNLKGEIPFPWNMKILDGNPDVVYLCESVIDALTLEEKGFSSVGIAGTSSFKPQWVRGFKNKKVFLAFDSDKPGQDAAEKLSEWFKKEDIFVSSIQLPEGMDVNEWFNS